MKMGLKEDNSAKLQNLFKEVLTKPASPNTTTGMTDIERQELIEKETVEDITAANNVIEMAFKRMSESL